jgi:hypothetical protein
MALVSIGTDIAWPGAPFYASPNQNGPTTLTTTGHWDGLVLRAEEDMTISHVGFRCNSATGSPTCNIRIETVNSSTGFPTGTLWATNTECTTVALSTGSWQVTALTASATITKGQYYALIFQKTATGTNFAVTYVGNSFIGATSGSIPQRVANTTGSAVHVAPPYLFVAALGSSLTTFYNVNGLSVFHTPTNISVTSTSTQAMAMKFVAPFKARISGIKFLETSNAAGADWTAAILDSSGNVLSSSSTAHDATYHYTSITSPTQNMRLANKVTIDAGSTYYAAIIPDTTTAVTAVRIASPGSDFNSLMPGAGACFAATRSGSTWTDFANQYIPIEIMIDQLDDGSGGGGGGAFFSGFVG